MNTKPRSSHPHFPKWVFNDDAPQSLENAAIQSGASLALLHSLLADASQNLPQQILRKRFSCAAAKNCLELEGRVVSLDDIRDSYYLARIGDEMGPDGEMLLLWRNACSINLRKRGWIDRLSVIFDHRFDHVMSLWIEETEAAGENRNPISRANAILTLVLHDVPHGETPALILTDAILARSLGWDYLLPLASRNVKRRFFQNMLPKQDSKSSLENVSLIDLHRSIALAAQDAYRYAYELAVRAAHMRTIAPKLRSKVSGAVVELFLTEDLVSPSTMLSPKIRGTNLPMTDRSALRICDRLIELAAIKEVTGRPTFRLYGL